jgi:hypothetical protein
LSGKPFSVSARQVDIQLLGHIAHIAHIVTGMVRLSGCRRYQPVEPQHHARAYGHAHKHALRRAHLTARDMIHAKNWAARSSSLRFPPEI